MVLSEPSAGIACLAFLSAVVLAPAAEELIFRGIIQSWLAQLLRRRAIKGLHDPCLDQQPVPTEEPLASEVSVDVLAPVDAEVTQVPLPLTESVPAEGLGAPPSQLVTGNVPNTYRPPDMDPEAVVSPDQVSIECRNGSEGLPDRTRRPSLLPIVITSAIFAALHLPQWPAPLAIFFLSMGLGTVYQRTGSLFASFILHALFNGFSTTLMFVAVLISQSSTPKLPPPAGGAPSAIVDSGSVVSHVVSGPQRGR